MDELDSKMLSLKPFAYNNDKFIACVGENGGTDDEDILEGFKTAAHLIIDNIIEQHGTEDELIYPLVFSIRHCVELALKISINRILEILRIKGETLPFPPKELHTHSIESLSKSIRSLFSVDKRIEPLLQVALRYSEDYFFDDKGDAFRYEKGLDEKSILVAKKISQISIGVLKGKFTRMMSLFDNAIAALEGIVEEYSVGTFTKELSRDDIAQIAQSLLPRAKWCEPEFDDCKKALKEKYQIGSNKLSDVIKIIEKHPLFSSYIGISIRLGIIKESELGCYSVLVNWAKKCYNEKEYYSFESFECENNTDSLEQIQSIETERNNIASGLSDEALYSLVAFGDMIQNSDKYCENYNKHYAYFRDNNMTRTYIIHKIEKYNFVLSILEGMEFCGQTEYLNILRPLIDQQERNI